MECDQILPATSFITTDIDGAVKLRVSQDDGAEVEQRPAVSVPALLELSTKKRPQALALTVKRNGSWQNWTYQDYLDEVRVVAKAFIKLGLEPRKSVGIIGFNSPEWFIADLAAVFANGVATGIYPTNSPEMCKFIVNDCHANIVVVEDEKQLAKFEQVKQDLTDLKMIIQYGGQVDGQKEGLMSWQQLLEVGRQESDQLLEERLKNVAINQCCHLVYTSGTTGRVKGVMLSHDNLTFTAKVLCNTFEMKDFQERIVSFLPLSHVAANVTDIFVLMTCVGAVYFADKDALKGSLTLTLKHAQPTLFLAVPRVWEKIHEKLLEAGKANKGLKQKIGQWAKKTGFKHNQRQLAAEATDTYSDLKYKVADRIVFKKVKAALGLAKCLRFFSAAAPISKDLLDYFLSLDIRILEIYGMSECSGPQLSNTYRHQKLGTIGKTLEGFHSKILPLDEDNTSMYGVMPEDAGERGEICMRGRNVMMGYLNNPDKTSEAFTEDEWLRSGDVAYLNNDGFTTITGRIKEILITAGGENVAPIAIEDAIKSHLPSVSNAMVVGDKRKFLSALLTLKADTDPDTLEPKSELAAGMLKWYEDLGSKAKTVDEAIHDDLVREALQRGIDKANEKAISNAQSIKKWIVLPRDFSIPGGELGPTLKLKRHVVIDKYASLIDPLYH